MKACKRPRAVASPPLDKRSIHRGGGTPTSERNGDRIEGFYSFAWKKWLESGPDCLVCAAFSETNASFVFRAVFKSVFFFLTHITIPRRSLSLELSDI